MAGVYAVPISPVTDTALFEHLMTRVTPEKREDIRGYRKDEDRLRRLYSDLLIRFLIMLETGMSNEHISFVYNAYGKPYLNGGEGVHFSASHSGAWVTAALDSQPVGLDVEHIMDADDDIAEYFFSESERRDLQGSPDPAGHFFNLWTLKESYVKLIGKGCSHPLQSISLRIPPAGAITAVVDGAPLEGVFFSLIPLHPDYKLALCGAHPRLPREVTFLPPQQLLSRFI